MYDVRQLLKIVLDQPLHVGDMYQPDDKISEFIQPSRDITRGRMGVRIATNRLGRPLEKSYPNYWINKSGSSRALQ